MGDDERRPGLRPRPTLAQTTRLVARALGMPADALMAGLRTATLDDLPALLALRARGLGDHLRWDDRAYLSWRYRLGRPDQGGGDCWVLSHNGAILGMVGTQDVRLRCGGQACPARSLMDILIAPELEGAGLGAWLNLALQARSPATLAIGANPQSIGMVSRLFDPLPHRRSHVHPTRFGRFLRERLPVPLAPGLLAFGLETLLRLGRAIALAPSSFGMQVRPLARFDQAMLDAVQAPFTDDPRLVHAERSAAALNWRLLDNPRARCDLWGAWSRRGRPAGIMATRLTPLDGGTRQALVVVDLLVPPLPEGRAALRALLWKVLGHAWRQGADYVLLTTCRCDVEAELARVGFRRQAHPYETLNWTCQDAGFQALAEACPDWTLSEVHTDRV